MLRYLIIDVNCNVRIDEDTLVISTSIVRLATTGILRHSSEFQALRNVRHRADVLARLN